MKVKFSNVGRDKGNWLAECEEITYDWLYKQVSPYLISSNINFANGTIFAGFHSVGKFEVIEE